jgi:hypothetical protein
MILRNILAALAATSLWLVSQPALAFNTLYASPSGVSAGSCPISAPCDLSYAISIAAPNDRVDVSAHGNYSETANIINTRLEIRGDCSNPSAVVFTNSTVAVWVQDGSIGIVDCLTIATGTGTGISTRQFTIADFHDVIFGANSVDLAAVETSRINCVGPDTIAANTYRAYHVMVYDHSTVELQCPITIGANATTSSFLTAQQMSLVRMDAATVSGNTVSGNQWILDNAELVKGAVAVPGNASTVSLNNAVIE